MAFFVRKATAAGASLSPARSVFGIKNNKIIVPIDFVILGPTPGAGFLQPNQSIGTEIHLVGGSSIGTIVSTPPAVIPGSDITPIVEVKDDQTINFPPFIPISASTPLIANETIDFIDTDGSTFLSGTLSSIAPLSLQPYLLGFNTVTAFKVTVPPLTLADEDIGSMVIIPRLGQSLGMFIGFGLGSALVFPAFSI
jgi:hypothetical protein